MRRHRFGRIAALIALGHLAAVVVLGVLALTTDQGDLLWTAVTRESGSPWFFGPGEDTLTVSWRLALVLVLVGALQSWALWQVLRGRVRGELTDRGRAVGLLRLALYLGVGYSLITIPLIAATGGHWLWSVTGVASGLVRLAVVGLFFLVLRDTASRGLRLFSLVAGTVACVSGIGTEITDAFGLYSAEQVFTLAGGYGHVWLAWSVSILVAQARDPRWSAATVRTGVVAQVMFVLMPSGVVSFGGNGFPDVLMVYTLLGAASVFGLVWDARTAHELANPLPGPGRGRAPARLRARWWPAAAAAVVLPAVPAAVNLARGRYHWIGPRGVIEQFVRVEGGSWDALTWLALDVFVGVGGPALLVLLAVLRRTRGAVRFTTPALTVAAAVGFVSALTATPLPEDFGDLYEGAQMYPDELFAPGKGGEVFVGISPSWYGAALLASALLLLLLYPAARVRRARRHVLLAGLATLVALGFVPAADQAVGPVTAAEDCGPPEQWRSEPARRDLTRDQRFVCSFRQGDLIRFAAATPDAVILAHARRLCGVYTRNDPQEVARLQAREGLKRDALARPLAEICPGAAATVKAAAVEQDREIREWEADGRRMCDSRPRHHPLIRPVTVTRVKDPQFTDYGVVETYEPTGDDEDPADDDLLERTQDAGLVAARPGHLMILTDPDFPLCVTVETYTRRPPVETKGWDHVAEVGYQSPTGAIVLTDELSGTELPDLSLGGRAGHYRIRVHYDEFTRKGQQENGQRLLIMAFPGKGDKPVTYRKPPKH
ncbi:hypothetical protein HTZ77_32000 [Nonomuraea sp. SMC257]|uniref:Uncharacterized protein n=1 Tax=Nonomuraea montanisoli TaxID=2741721 RepID=A0A7Y6IE77_9ACTN|nr:hypothetical protein [Nonomuraea montanisoli]NUW36008.1 hypothetical protein [Nonomuraea montanisoli]